MNTKQILNGIKSATCKQQLSLHVDLIEKALDRGQCNYNRLEDQQIAEALSDKINEFKH